MSKGERPQLVRAIQAALVDQGANPVDAATAAEQLWTYGAGVSEIALRVLRALRRIEERVMGDERPRFGPRVGQAALDARSEHLVELQRQLREMTEERDRERQRAEDAAQELIRTDQKLQREREDNKRLTTLLANATDALTRFEAEVTNIARGMGEALTMPRQVARR